MAVSQALGDLMRNKAQLVLVVNEFGEMGGIVNQEDIFEFLLGLEIIVESDTVKDMQKLARQLWKRRAQQLGIKTEQGG